MLEEQFGSQPQQTPEDEIANLQAELASAYDKIGTLEKQLGEALETVKRTDQVIEDMRSVGNRTVLGETSASIADDLDEAIHPEKVVRHFPQAS